MPVSMYSVGDCPICSGSGILLVLVDVALDRPIFFCPLCANAYTFEPVGRLVDEINRVIDVAPNGVRLPTALHMSRLGLSASPLGGDRVAFWYPMLVQELRRVGLTIVDPK